MSYDVRILRRPGRQRFSVAEPRQCRQLSLLRSAVAGLQVPASDGSCKGLARRHDDEMSLKRTQVRKNYQYSWCVDPLDGTKEFIKRNGQARKQLSRRLEGPARLLCPGALHGLWRR